MKEFIVHWLTVITQPFWTSPLGMDQFVDAMQETIQMVLLSFLFGGIWGLIQGVALVVTRDKGILPNKAIYHGLNPIINALRSLPFFILAIAVIPLTKWIVGS